MTKQCSLFILLILSWSNIALAVNIPFEMVKGLMIIEASVDGQAGRFIFDTGADHFIIDSKHISDDQVLIYTGSGETRGSVLQISELSVGSVSKGKVDAAIMDLSGLDNFLGFDVKGIMPGKIFEPHYLEIDFTNRLIVVAHKINKSNRAKFNHQWEIENHDRIALVKTHFGDKDAYLILDSGASTTYLTTEAIHSITGSSPTGRSNNTITTEGTTISREYLLPTLSIGDHSVQNLKVYEIDMTTLSSAMGKNIQGIVNLRFLSETNILFDFKKNLVYF